MKTVHSTDGTLIAFDPSGAGPALILVAGGMGLRSNPTFRRLEVLLAPHFTVYNYDRRGRGDSGDTLPYAVVREIEDIAALIEEAGGSAHLFGISSGATLALEAAATFPHKIEKLALYDPPILLDDSRPPLPDNYVAHVNVLLAAGQREEAVEYFLQEALQIPAEDIAPIRADPEWQTLREMAPTIAYDGMIMAEMMSGKGIPWKRWQGVTMPTLVMSGEKSDPHFGTGAQALVHGLPNARLHILEGQTHNVDSNRVAPVLIQFYKGAIV